MENLSNSKIYKCYKKVFKSWCFCSLHKNFINYQKSLEIISITIEIIFLNNFKVIIIYFYFLKKKGNIMNMLMLKKIEHNIIKDARNLFRLQKRNS